MIEIPKDLEYTPEEIEKFTNRCEKVSEEAGGDDECICSECPFEWEGKLRKKKYGAYCNGYNKVTSCKQWLSIYSNQQEEKQVREFKVGDTVTIVTKEWLEENCDKTATGYYHPNSTLRPITTVKEKKLGREATIESEDGREHCYCIDGSGGWHPWMFQEYHESTPKEEEREELPEPEIKEEIDKDKIYGLIDSFKNGDIHESELHKAIIEAQKIEIRRLKKEHQLKIAEYDYACDSQASEIKSLNRKITNLHPDIEPTYQRAIEIVQSFDHLVEKEKWSIETDMYSKILLFTLREVQK